MWSGDHLETDDTPTGDICLAYNLKVWPVVQTTNIKYDFNNIQGSAIYQILATYWNPSKTEQVK